MENISKISEKFLVLPFGGLTDAQSQKIPYQNPKLVIFGSVSSLTMAKGGTMADGNSGMNMN